MKKLICAATILFAVAACNNSSKTNDNTPVKWEFFSGDKNIKNLKMPLFVKVSTFTA